MKIPADDSTRCDRCGGPIESRAGESIYTGRLRWYVSSSCKTCGPHSEIDGVDFPPESLRLSIIEESGLWSLQFEELKSKAPAAKILVELIGLSRKEALTAITSNPNLAWSGTKIEIEWLILALAGVGVKAAAIELRTGSNS